jgi:nucleotide-binding universal stress UspA family protein
VTGRIIVALDESAASDAALRSAVRLAAAQSAELLALFIEDTDLFAAASLSCTSTVTYQGALIEPLDEGILARSLRIRARRLREHVERTAAAYKVPWHFQSIRGRVSDEILRVAASCEMIAVGYSSGAPGSRHVGRTASAILAGARCAVLATGARSADVVRIIVLGDQASRAPAIATALARATGAQLVHQVQETDAARMMNALQRLGSGFLVADRKALAKMRVSPQELARKLDLDGLIVTDGEASA